MMEPNEIVRQLRELLPPKVDYAKLVCAEGFAHGQYFVWEDPEPYTMEAAADCIERLQAELILVTDELARYKKHGLEPCDYAGIIATEKKYEEANQTRQDAMDALKNIMAELRESKWRERAAVEAVQKRIMHLEKIEPKSLADRLNIDGVLAILDGLLTEISGQEQEGE